MENLPLVITILQVFIGLFVLALIKSIFNVFQGK